MGPRSTFLLMIAVILVSALGSGCGSGGESEPLDPAAAVPPDAVAFVEFPVQPGEEVKANAELAARGLAGVGDLEEWVVSELEETVAGKSWYPNLRTEVWPWMGARGGAFARGVSGSDLEGYGAVFEVTDEQAAMEFVDAQLGLQDSPPDEGSYEGVEFQVVSGTGGVVGVFDGLLALAENEAVFESMVDAADQGGLADEKRYTDLSATTPSGPMTVYADIGELAGQLTGGIDPTTMHILSAAGVDLEHAAAFASVTPHPSAIEIYVSTNLAGADQLSGDEAALLASLPDTAFFAVVLPEFGPRFARLFEYVDQEGIPGMLPPKQPGKMAARAAVDPERIAGSVRRAAFFMQGTDKKDFGVALVLVMASPGQARAAASGLRRLVSSSELELGGRPIVIANRGRRVTIGSRVHSARAGLGGLRSTLADPTYPSEYPARHYYLSTKVIGETPIVGLLDLWDGLKAASNLIPPDEERFSAIEPYLDLIYSIAVGVDTSHGSTTLRVTVGY